MGIIEGNWRGIEEFTMTQRKESSIECQGLQENSIDLGHSTLIYSTGGSMAVQTFQERVTPYAFQKNRGTCACKSGELMHLH